MMDRELQHLALLGRVRFHGDTRFDDDYIDRWSAVYLANHLHARGVPYEAFLQHPEPLLQAVVFAGLDDVEDDAPAPLLPAQQRIADRITQDLLIRDEAERHVAHLERQCSTVRVRDGRFVEPLHHHAFPRKPRRAVAP